MRKHYCVYVERFAQCRKLSDAELGRLHRALMDAYETGQQHELSGRESIVYDAMYEDVTQDAEKQKRKSKTYRDNVKKRWNNGIQLNTTVYNGIQLNTIVSEPLESRDSAAPEPQNSPIYIHNTPNTYTSEYTKTDISYTYGSTEEKKEKNQKKEKKNTDIERDTYRGKGGTGGEGDFFRAVCEYLNSKAGTRYRPSTPKTQACIRARMREGFGLEDFQTVIDKKCAEWAGTEMAQYLRPETLFGTKFEGYLNQPTRKPQADKSWDFETLGDNGNQVFVEPDEEGGFPF